MFNLTIAQSQSAKQNHNVDKINSLIDSSRVYFNSTAYDKSLEKAKKALSLALKYDDNSQTASIYNLIGLNFSQVNDDDNAIDYFNKSLVYATKAKNDTILSWVNRNLGNLYSHNKEDNQTGIQYYLKAIDHSKNVNKVEYLYNLVNLTTAYVNIENFEKAIDILNEIKPHLNGIENEEELKYYYYYLMGNYNEWRNFNGLAENNYLQAYAICLSKPERFLKSHELEICELLEGFYKRPNSIDKSELFAFKSDSLQKVFFNLEQAENIRVLSQQIEKEEVKSKLDKLEAEKEIQDQKLANLKLLSILIIVSFIGILLLLYYQFKLSKIRKTNNEELKKSNEALQIAKEKAEEATLLKTQFVSTISHELRTPLYGVIGITDIL